MILFPSHTINYHPPSNFVEKDSDLFHPTNFQNSIDEVEMTIIKNAVVTNCYVFDNFKFLYYLTNQTKPKFKFYYKEIIKKWFYPTAKVEKATFGVQISSSNYFHWVTETLPGLLKVNKVNKNTIVILSNQDSRYFHISNTLELLEIPHIYMKKDQNLKISELYTFKLPTVANYNEHFLNEMKASFYHKLKLNTDTIPFRNIYISRRKATYRKISNEDDVETLLRKYNFEVVYLEELTVEQQIKLSFESKLIISSHGAGLTNILFMQPQQRVIELKAKNNDYWCFFTLARVANLDYNYLLCESETIDHRVSDIQVDLNQLKKLL